MQTVSETIQQANSEAEISRLRFLVGSLREEAWNLIWGGLEMDEQRYKDETDRLLYGESK